MPDEAVAAPSMSFAEFEASRQSGAPIPEPAVEISAPAPEPAQPEASETSHERDEHGKFKAQNSDVPPGVQKRINKAVADQRQAERERDYLRQQLADFQAQKPVASADAEKEPDVADFAEPKEYVKAMARYEAKRTIAAERKAATEATEKAKAAEVEQRQKQDHAAAIESWNKSESNARTAHEDYDAALDATSDLTITEALAAAIYRSDSQAELAYHLAKNRPELERLIAIPPHRIDFEIGKLEAKLHPAEKPKPITSAPKPPSPVGARSAASSGDPMKAENFKDFEARRNAQLYTKK